jgi:hypothetical protein
VLEAGEQVADASVWTAPHQRVGIHELLREGAALFFFYLFDWSST